jgi:Tfp pilus assembly protein PilN
MNIKTILSDPMRDLIFSPDVIVDSMRPILAALIGSSIETSWNPSFTVDLDLNKEGRLPLLYDERATQVIAPEDRPTPWFKVATAAGAATLALSLASYGFVGQFDIPNKQKQIDQLAALTVKSNADLKQLSALRKENDVLTNKKRILDNIIKKSNHWSTVLDSIRNGIPGSVQIENISIDKNATIQGEALDFQGVSNFAINLSTAPGFTDANVQSASRKEKTPEIVFYEIVARIAGLDEPTPATAQALADGKTDAQQNNPLPKIINDMQIPQTGKKAAGAM